MHGYSRHVFHQYELINNQQHFGKVTFVEPTYIDFILKFIKSASFSIPHKLSSILKPSDFAWASNISSIGVLRQNFKAKIYIPS